MSGDQLCFFTTSYPFGQGETFIENEISYLAGEYNRVPLFHRYKTGIAREVPPNVELIYIPEPNTTKTRPYFLKNIHIILIILVAEFFLSRQRRLFIRGFRYNLNHILNSMYYASEVSNRLSDEIKNAAVFYSYWFFDWNFSLSILKFRRIITHNFTRAHGFDLYENTSSVNYLPFRRFCLRNTDRIFAVSEQGRRYLSQRYPGFSNRIKKAYLGTEDHGTNPMPEDLPIHIVSCSNVNDVKRVHLVIEILRCFAVQVRWTHFGDGPQLDQVKSMAALLPENISSHFAGRKSQADVFRFYSSVPVHVFVNTSISEGLPVSIMEAISFGIPVLATNVGGTSEIVDKEFGWLLNSDFDPREAASWISSIVFRNDYPEMRRKARNKWDNWFSAGKNYNEFVEYLRVK